MQPSHSSDISGTFFDGIALFDPIGGKAGGENQDAKAGEAHVADGGEGGAEVGAAVERATAAVNDDVGVLGKRQREFLEVGDALVGRAGPVKG